MRIFYINIAARKDRRAAMEQRFSLYDLQATRINAVTPADLSKTDIEKYCQPRNHHWLTKPELACSLSHVAALNQFLKCDDPFGLILEDDVLISPSLKSFLHSIESAQPAIDLLRIENSDYPLRLSPSPLEIIDDIKLTKYFSWCSGSAGYIISRRGAKRIINGQEIRFLQADCALFNPFKKIAGDLRSYHAVPALCKQVDAITTRNAPESEGDIQKSRINRAEIEKALFARRVIYNIQEFFERDVRIASIKMWERFSNGALKKDVPFKSD